MAAGIVAGLARTALGGVVNSIGAAANNMLTQSARGIMGHNANGVSAAAQAAQGAYNANQANIANGIGTDRIAQQYGFNSAQASAANAFTQEMWERAAAYNAEEAQKQRDWAERMESTKYQRAVKDMESAGLNPILAATGGGVSVGSGGGSAASMSGASGAMASGGLLQGINATESSYTGQLEYMGGILGLLGAALGNLGSAQNMLGKYGESFIKAVGDLINYKNDDYIKGNYWIEDRRNNARPGTYEYNYKNHWNNYWDRKGIKGNSNGSRG